MRIEDIDDEYVTKHDERFARVEGGGTIVSMVFDYDGEFDYCQVHLSEDAYINADEISIGKDFAKLFLNDTYIGDVKFNYDFLKVWGKV